MCLTGLAIATAPALFVLLWSTGFIGARFGLPYIEPLTFLAVRLAFVVLDHGRYRNHRGMRGGRMQVRSAIAWLLACWYTASVSEECSLPSVKAFPSGFQR